MVQHLGIRDPGPGKGLHQVIGPLVSRRHGDDDGNPENLAQAAGVDAATPSLELVVHIEHEHHGTLKFDQLQGEKQGPPEVLGIRDLNDRGVRVLGEESPRYTSFVTPGRKVIETRGVDDLLLQPVERRASPHQLHRRARVVRHGDVAPGEVPEQQALADVRIAHQNDGALRRRDLGIGRHVPDSQLRLE